MINSHHIVIKHQNQNDIDFYRFFVLYREIIYIFNSYNVIFIQNLKCLYKPLNVVLSNQLIQDGPFLELLWGLPSTDERLSTTSRTSFINTSLTRRMYM